MLTARLFGPTFQGIISSSHEDTRVPILKGSVFNDLQDLGVVDDVHIYVRESPVSSFIKLGLGRDCYFSRLQKAKEA